MTSFRTRRDGRVYRVRNSGPDMATFLRLQQQDEARRTLNENEARAQLQRRAQSPRRPSLSERVSNVLAKLTPDEIKVTLSADMTFLHVESEFKWNLIRRKLILDLTPEQKMKLLKAEY